MRLVDKLVFLVIVIIVISGYFYYKGEFDLNYFDKELTSRECADQGGEIINSLNSECETKELGDISDLTCPCVCCEKE
jgi:hypothetical protein